MRQIPLLIVVSAIALSQTGCAMMHDLQPHRLWRWNRGPAPSSDPYFSISDPVPASAPRTATSVPPSVFNEMQHDEPVADHD